MPVDIPFITNRRVVDDGGNQTFSNQRNPDSHRLTFGKAALTLDETQAKTLGLAPVFDDLPVTLAERTESDPDHAPGWAALRQLIRDDIENRRDCVIYIHGFDTSFNDAIWYTGQLQYQLSQRLDWLRSQGIGADLRVPGSIRFMVYSWPANRAADWIAKRSVFFRKAIAGTGYAPDLGDSRRSARATANLLNLIDNLGGAEGDENSGRLHLMCQSMGVRALNQGFRDYRNDKAGQVLPKVFDRIFFSGSDIGSRAFEKSNDLKELPELANKITVYHNSNDTLGTLSVLLRMLPFTGERKRMSKYGVLNPAAVNSVDTVDVSASVKKPSNQTKEDTAGHYYARLNPDVLADIVRCISGTSWAGTSAVDGRKIQQHDNDFVLC